MVLSPRTQYFGSSLKSRQRFTSPTTASPTKIIATYPVFFSPLWHRVAVLTSTATSWTRPRPARGLTWTVFQKENKAWLSDSSRFRISVIVIMDSSGKGQRQQNSVQTPRAPKLRNPNDVRVAVGRKAKLGEDRRRPLHRSNEVRGLSAGLGRDAHL